MIGQLAQFLKSVGNIHKGLAHLLLVASPVPQNNSGTNPILALQFLIDNFHYTEHHHTRCEQVLRAVPYTVSVAFSVKVTVWS